MHCIFVDAIEVDRSYGSFFCGSQENGESSCTVGQTCLAMENPDGINFDHMGRALISIFLAVGLDGLQVGLNA